jgi:hypothetical protein
VVVVLHGAEAAVASLAAASAVALDRNQVQKCNASAPFLMKIYGIIWWFQGNCLYLHRQTNK